MQKVENIDETPAFAKHVLAEVPLVVSFSGGRTSAFMARALQIRYENKERELVFIFANTGKERTETLDFVNECDKRWNLGVTWLEYDLEYYLIHNNKEILIEKKRLDRIIRKFKKVKFTFKSTFKIVSYETASRNGEPFEKMITKYGLPNKALPHCTRELKGRTITRYLRTIGLKNGMYETAIGIRIDEAHRINWQTAKRDRFIYPLATDFRATKDFIRTWWDRQEFDLQLKDYEGNCDMCWKKSERKLLTMILEKPHLIEWWNEMEIKYGQGEFSFFRNNKTAIDLIEMSKQNFTKATDEYEAGKCQTKLFDYDLDIEYDCFCKSS